MRSQSFKGQRKYKTYNVSSVNRTSNFYENGTKGEICGIIQNVFQCEGPVELDRVIELVRSEWGMARAGNKIRELVRKCITLLDFYIKKDRSTEYVWSNTNDLHLSEGFRVPDSEYDFKRPISKIPTFEIINAAGAILKENVSLPLDSLITEITNVFGVQRTTEPIKKEIRSIIMRTAKNREWKIDEDMISSNTLSDW